MLDRSLHLTSREVSFMDVEHLQSSTFATYAPPSMICRGIAAYDFEAGVNTTPLLVAIRVNIAKPDAAVMMKPGLSLSA
jgi:hypothetical protein